MTERQTSRTRTMPHDIERERHAPPPPPYHNPPRDYAAELAAAYARHGITWPPDESGPCATCGDLTHRYGHGGGPLCPDCTPRKGRTGRAVLPLDLEDEVRQAFGPTDPE